MNPILKEILNSLRFKCQEACSQTYPLKELIRHKDIGQCRAGYIRPADDFSGIKN